MPLSLNEDPRAIIRPTFEEEITDNILSFGNVGSSGKKASPILKIERTEIMYSTDGSIYTPIIFGLYALINSAAGCTSFDAKDAEEDNMSTGRGMSLSNLFLAIKPKLLI